MSYANPAAYDRFMGRWSARLTPSFLGFAQVNHKQHVLDVGCGTGILSRAVISSGAAVKVTGIDPLVDYIDFARKAVASPRVQFQVGAAESMPFPDKTFDAALALLVLQDFSAPAQAVREMARVTRPGGVVAACLWDFAEGLPMLSLLWEAAEAVAPDAVSLRRANQRSQHASLNDLEALSGLLSLQYSDRHAGTADAILVIRRLLAAVPRRINADLGVCRGSQRANRRRTCPRASR